MAEMLHCAMKRQGNSVLFIKMYKRHISIFKFGDTGESESGKESMKCFLHFPSLEIEQKVSDGLKKEKKRKEKRYNQQRT